MLEGMPDSHARKIHQDSHCGPVMQRKDVKRGSSHFSGKQAVAATLSFLGLEVG